MFFILAGFYGQNYSQQIKPKRITDICLIRLISCEAFFTARLNLLGFPSSFAEPVG